MARNRSPSPVDGFPLGRAATSPQPLLSKRDKRRNQLADKLSEMMATFSDNRDNHYRAQLAALQADINLILKADPYTTAPLEDDGSESKELIMSVMGTTTPAAPSAGTDYVAQVGKYYSRYVDAANDALEERDYNLTQLWAKHENTRIEIENAYMYKAQIAEEEHKQLANTIRERLTASIQQRTNRLRREKEQLDLSDSNAMLLHPNQFSINNPASPGGPQVPRKTRRTGHKFGEGDDLAGAAAENKRKRKLFEENDNETPGPSGRNLDLGVGSPFREAKARTMNTQFEAAAYSLERLFTEKELTMAINHATTAASHFFAKMKNADTAPDAPTNGTNGNGTNGTNGTANDHASENGDAMDVDQDSDAPAGAPDMARTVSQNPHATRGATRSAFNPSAVASGRLPFIHNPPFILDAKVFQKPNAQAPTPPALGAADVDQDLVLMFREAPPDDALNERLLQTAIVPVKAREYQVQPPEYAAPCDEITSHVRALAPHLEVGGGGGGDSVAASAQGSLADQSDAGAGTPLRAGESVAGGAGAGGVGMARTASGSGRGRGGRRAL